MATRFLTYVEYLGITPSTTSFSLDDTLLPAGALDAAHLTYRVRSTGGFWGPWARPLTWNQVTRTFTTTTHPALTAELHIRRVTPRAAVYNPPTRPEQRLDEENLRHQADQGQMVVYEWAGELGFDVLDPLLIPDYVDLDDQLRSLTQAHFRPADIARPVGQYNFRFAGGYMSRAHVKLQARINGTWTLLPLSALSWNVPENNAPFRFVGPNTIRADFSAYAADTIDGLLIHRHTPRNSVVSVVEEGDGITAIGMEPSATQSLFIAVEVGEELAKIVPCECALYYTSNLYPVLATDAVTLAVPGATGGIIWGIPDDGASFSVPGLLNGTLAVAATAHTMPFPDGASVSVPVLQDGTLLVTIKSHVMPFPDGMSSSVPLLQDGTLLVTIVSHTMPVPDGASVNVPVLQNGTLS